MSTAQNGNTIKVHYTGKLNDGTVFDSSEGRDPLEFTIGSGQVIPGFDKGVIDMQLKERKNIVIACGDAYGQRNENLVFDFPKDQIPPDMDPQIGDTLQLMQENGQPVVVTVAQLNEETLSLDANHPLAGEDLTFDVELVEIIS